VGYSAFRKRVIILVTCLQSAAKKFEKHALRSPSPLAMHYIGWSACVSARAYAGTRGTPLPRTQSAGVEIRIRGFCSSHQLAQSRLVSRSRAHECSHLFAKNSGRSNSSLRGPLQRASQRMHGKNALVARPRSKRRAHLGGQLTSQGPSSGL
jgi:hypothetical protein